MKIHVALCTDENFTIPALVCVTSLFETNRHNDCEVYILTDGLSDKATSKFRKLSEYYNQKVEICEINEHSLTTLITTDRYPKSMYFRFILPEILHNINKVLYLDCDILVRHNLEDLFKIELNNKACAVVEDQQSDDIQIINRLHIKFPYFNSGVMLMNLSYWRENNIAAKILNFIGKNPTKCVYPDQDGLNVILDKDVIYLDYKYNYQEMWLTMRDYARIHFLKWKALDVAAKDPAIVHFCVDEKPWFIECRNPFKNEYLQIANKHDFIGFKRKPKYRFIYTRLEAEIMRLRRWQKKFINR